MKKTIVFMLNTLILMVIILSVNIYAGIHPTVSVVGSDVHISWTTDLIYKDYQRVVVSSEPNISGKISEYDVPLTETSYVLSGYNPGDDLYVCVYIEYIGYPPVYSSWYSLKSNSDSHNVVEYPSPQPPKNVEVTLTENSIDVTWDDQDAAEYYRVYCFLVPPDDGDPIEQNQKETWTNKYSYKLDDIKKGYDYYFYVQACREDEHTRLEITSEKSKYAYFTYGDKVPYSVTETDYALKKINGEIKKISDKDDSDEITKLILFIEEIIADNSRVYVYGENISLDKNLMKSTQAASVMMAQKSSEMMESAGIEVVRVIRANVKVILNPELTSFNMTFKKDLSSSELNYIYLCGSNYKLGLNIQSSKEDFASNIEISTSFEKNLLSISTNKELTGDVVVSLPPLSLVSTEYQTFQDDLGNIIPAKVNPATNNVEGKLNFRMYGSETEAVSTNVSREKRITYSTYATNASSDSTGTSISIKVVENKKDFNDISEKSTEMKEAIRILASKGILNGTSKTTFSPDSSISRAEITALIIRATSSQNIKAVSNFEDLPKTHWSYKEVSSAYNLKIVNGVSTTLFNPDSVISKDQITAMVARTLASLEGYKYPASSSYSKLFSKFNDSNNFAEWAKKEIAFACRENLVIYSVDGMFNSDKPMTRGDAAIILYRMFNKVW